MTVSEALDKMEAAVRELDAALEQGMFEGKEENDTEYFVACLKMQNHLRSAYKPLYQLAMDGHRYWRKHKKEQG